MNDSSSYLAKVSVSQASLAACLARVTQQVDPGKYWPGADSLLLTANNTGLHFAGSDGNIILELDLKTQVDQTGSIWVSGFALTDLINTFDQGSVELQFEEDQLEVACENTRVVLNGRPACNFPVNPPYQRQTTIFLPGPGLKSALEQMIFAVLRGNRSAIRPIQLIIEDDQLTMAVSDGCRLIESRLVLDYPVAEKVKYLVPAQALVSLSANIGTAEEVALISTCLSTRIAFAQSDFSLMVRLDDSQFFDNWRQIPGKCVVRAEVDTRELLTTLHRTEILTGQKEKSVTISFKPGLLMVSGPLSEIGSAAARLAAKVIGDELAITIRLAYLLEMLMATDSSKVSIEVARQDQIGVFRVAGNNGFVHLTMPCVVSEGR